MARRRFFVEEVRDGRAQVHGDQAHHLARVLRIEPGQKFELCDNHNVFLAAVDTVRKDFVSFSIVERVAPAQAMVTITLVASLIRFERFEWLLEKATELGVETIIPVLASRSEKGLDTAGQKRVTRWRKIVLEASEQSRRSRLPHIQAPIALSHALLIEADVRYVLDEHAAANPLAACFPARRSVHDQLAVLVGPEGGWTDPERTEMLERGWLPVGIGSTILRTETAAIAGIAIIVAAWPQGGHSDPGSDAGSALS